jgi:citrate lyase beta subunit
MHARAVMAAVKSSGTNTPVVNGHVIKPAVLREAARVIAIASKVSSNAPASAQGSPP